MKHKKWLWKLTLPLILAVATVLVPVQSASALATVEGWWGYSINNPHAHYFSNFPYNNNFWAQGEYFFDQYAFDGSYVGVQFTQINFNAVSNDDVNITGYANGRQVVYLMTNNCVLNQNSETVGNHWRLESIASDQINYTNHAQSPDVDGQTRNLWQIVYRNDTSDTTIPGHIPIGLWCTDWTSFQSGREKPMVNLAAVSIYGPQPFIDYSQQLQEIKDAIENGSDAGEVLQQQREEDRQDMENAQGDADNGSNQSSQDISSSTGNFMSSIGAVVGALSSPGTNCNINMNFGILNLGNVNLCQIPTELKTIINTLSSIAITLAVLWTSYKGITTILEQIGNVVNT